MIRIWKKTFPYSLMMSLMYMQTFITFPGIMIKHKVKGLPYSWALVIYLFAFNLFDTIGKSEKIGGNRKKYTGKTTHILFILRFINLIAYYYLATGTTKAPWF